MCLKCSCNHLPGCVFNVVSLVKDKHRILKSDVHSSPYDWVKQVIVGAENEVCLSCINAYVVSTDSCRLVKSWRSMSVLHNSCSMHADFHCFCLTSKAMTVAASIHMHGLDQTGS